MPSHRCIAQVTSERNVSCFLRGVLCRPCIYSTKHTHHILAWTTSNMPNGVNYTQTYGLCETWSICIRGAVWNHPASVRAAKWHFIFSTTTTAHFILCVVLCSLWTSYWMYIQYIYVLFKEWNGKKVWESDVGVGIDRRSNVSNWCQMLLLSAHRSPVNGCMHQPTLLSVISLHLFLFCSPAFVSSVPRVPHQVNIAHTRHMPLLCVGCMPSLSHTHTYHNSWPSITATIFIFSVAFGWRLYVYVWVLLVCLLFLYSLVTFVCVCVCACYDYFSTPSSQQSADSLTGKLIWYPTIPFPLCSSQIRRLPLWAPDHLPAAPYITDVPHNNTNGPAWTFFIQCTRTSQLKKNYECMHHTICSVWNHLCVMCCIFAVHRSPCEQLAPHIDILTVELVRHEPPSIGQPFTILLLLLSFCFASVLVIWIGTLTWKNRKRKKNEYIRKFNNFGTSKCHSIFKIYEKTKTSVGWEILS